MKGIVYFNHLSEYGKSQILKDYGNSSFLNKEFKSQKDFMSVSIKKLDYNKIWDDIINSSLDNNLKIKLKTYV